MMGKTHQVIGEPGYDAALENIKYHWCDLYRLDCGFVFHLAEYLTG